MVAFIPGASPPEVSTAIRLISKRLPFLVIYFGVYYIIILVCIVEFSNIFSYNVGCDIRIIFQKVIKGDNMGTLDFTDYIYDAQQGSQSAIKFIYDNTLPSFYKEALAFMRNRDDAECAVRDAYIFVLDHLMIRKNQSAFTM